MAKTLKTGDVKRIHRNDFESIWSDDNWIVFGRSDIRPFGALSRSAARQIKEVGERIAKIIKRGPTFLFVEVSK